MFQPSSTDRSFMNRNMIIISTESLKNCLQTSRQKKPKTKSRNKSIKLFDNASSSSRRNSLNNTMRSSSQYEFLKSEEFVPPCNNTQKIESKAHKRKILMKSGYEFNTAMSPSDLKAAIDKRNNEEMAAKENQYESSQNDRFANSDAISGLKDKLRKKIEVNAYRKFTNVQYSLGNKRQEKVQEKHINYLLEMMNTRNKQLNQQQSSSANEKFNKFELGDEDHEGEDEDEEDQDEEPEPQIKISQPKSKVPEQVKKPEQNNSKKELDLNKFIIADHKNKEELKKMEDKKLEERRIEEKRMEAKKMEERRMEEKRMEQKKLQEKKQEEKKLEEKRASEKKLEEKKMEEKRKLQEKKIEEKRLEQKRAEEKKLEEKRQSQKRLEQQKEKKSYQKRLEEERKKIPQNNRKPVGESEYTQNQMNEGGKQKTEESKKSNKGNQDKSNSFWNSNMDVVEIEPITYNQSMKKVPQVPKKDPEIPIRKQEKKPSIVLPSNTKAQKAVTVSKQRYPTAEQSPESDSEIEQVQIGVANKKESQSLAKKPSIEKEKSTANNKQTKTSKEKTSTTNSKENKGRESKQKLQKAVVEAKQENKQQVKEKSEDDRNQYTVQEIKSQIEYILYITNEIGSIFKLEKEFVSEKSQEIQRLSKLSSYYVWQQIYFIKEYSLQQLSTKSSDFFHIPGQALGDPQLDEFLENEVSDIVGEIEKVKKIIQKCYSQANPYLASNQKPLAIQKQVNYHKKCITILQQYFSEIEKEYRKIVRASANEKSQRNHIEKLCLIIEVVCQLRFLNGEEMKDYEELTEIQNLTTHYQNYKHFVLF